MSPRSPAPGVYELPASAVASLANPDVRLELHNITFSHYCERARWTLRLLGVPYEEVGARGMSTGVSASACVHTLHPTLQLGQHTLTLLFAHHTHIST